MIPIRGETYYYVIALLPAQRRGESQRTIVVCDCLILCAAEGREPENNHVSVIPSFPAQRRGESQRTIQILWYIRAEVGENVWS